MMQDQFIYMMVAAFLILFFLLLIWAFLTLRIQRTRNKIDTDPTNKGQQPPSDESIEKAAQRFEKVFSSDLKTETSLGWEPDAHAKQGVVPKITDFVLGTGKTILIADDDPVVSLALTRRLEHMGYQVYRTTDAMHALLGIKKIQPDLAILDLEMPSGNGLAVCEMLACDKECSKIPLVVHSVFEDENIIRRCQQMNAHYVRKSPRSWVEIKQLIDTLIGQNKPKEEEPSIDIDALLATKPMLETSPESVPDANMHKAAAEAPSPDMPSAETIEKLQMVSPWEYKPITVLCIDDDPVIIRSIAIRLQPYNIRVREANNGTQGYLSAVADPPNLILLDIKMPNGQGDYVLSKLKDNPYTKDIPVLILTIESTAGVQRRMTSLGAEGLVKKPVHWPDLFAQMGKCIQLPEQLLRDYELPLQLSVHEL